MVAEVHLHAAAADRRACGDAEGGDDSKGGDLPAVRGSCVTRARGIGGVGIRRAVRPHVARPSERTGLRIRRVESAQCILREVSVYPVRGRLAAAHCLGEKQQQLSSLDAARGMQPLQAAAWVKDAYVCMQVFNQKKSEDKS